MSLLVTSYSLGHDYALVDLWYYRSVFTSRGQYAIHNVVLAVLRDSPVFFKGDRSGTIFKRWSFADESDDNV
jgi:hypothetical protein